MLRERKQLRRFYALLPLIGLLACLGIINLMPSWGGVATEGASVTPTPAAPRWTPGSTVKTEASPSAPVGTPATLTQAPSRAPAPTPVPTLPPQAAIQLLGPPGGSVLDLSQEGTFYWDANFMPPAGASFVLDFLTATGTIPAGTPPQPGAGDVYYLSLRPATVTHPADIAGWQVRLVAPAGQTLLASESRALRHVTP